MYTETESTTFHMLAPQKGTYLLDIFAATYPNYEMCQKKEATKYINVCRFRINCPGVDKVNVPLPECAPGMCEFFYKKFSNMIIHWARNEKIVRKLKTRSLCSGGVPLLKKII